MGYKPRVLKGKVKGTGWPIDGHVLYFSQWDYDNHGSYHLYGWDDPDDEAVKETMYRSEVDAGLNAYDTREEFEELWASKKWEPSGAFCLELDQVEVVEVLQEEERDDMRDKLQAYGIDITPRKSADKGGILCLPLDENLNGDVQSKHPDWKPTNCPHCKRKCWLPGSVEAMVEKQGVQLLCTACALEVGLIQPNKANRKQRREARREARRRH